MLARALEARAQPLAAPPREPAYRILFVCLGNICRSPLAEGVARRRLAERGLVDRVGVDSAGTSGWNEGAPPDTRARIVAARHGFRIDDLRARQFVVGDFDRFEWIVVFDRVNRDAVLALARSAEDRRRVVLLDEDVEIADPILGALRDFERTYRSIAAATERLVAQFA